MNDWRSVSCPSSSIGRSRSCAARRAARRTCFYQKHFTDQLPPGVSPIPIREKEDEAEESIYLRIRDVQGLIGLVQIGVLELHPWGSRVDRLEHPDMMIFDLDPGPGITHPQLIESALLVKERLDDLGLRSFVKTSGGKGFHIVVPLARRSSWDEVKAFSGAVAEDLVRRLPARFVATMTKSKRTGKVFLDYFRNARGSTSVARTRPVPVARGRSRCPSGGRILPAARVSARMRSTCTNGAQSDPAAKARPLGRIFHAEAVPHPPACDGGWRPEVGGSFLLGRSSPTVSAMYAWRSPIGFSPPTVVSCTVWCSISESTSAPSSTM